MIPKITLIGEDIAIDVENSIRISFQSGKLEKESSNSPLRKILITHLYYQPLISPTKTDYLTP